MKNLGQESFEVVMRQPIPKIRKSPTMCLHDSRYIIVTGGDYDDSDNRRVDCFDLVSNKWSRLPDMNIGRYKA